ncbi:PH domain-containing protein [Citricoccus sp. SGAir0253]|uniref:PH domain-containing protein n=1 Tax=Citricoccus sp. SGAir0253 TaxID=2567881 RepID=UPI00143D122E|nr:PH domain-containing protein [Citricoccus sp. SGAir0253]
MGLRLTPGEQVRVRTRAHPRALTAPVLRLLLIALATGYVQGLLARADLPSVLVQARPALSGTVWVLAGLAVLAGSVRPAWRWLARTTVLTTRRIVRRDGAGRTRERAVHLLAVDDVRLEQRRGQRRSGAGTLVVAHGGGSHLVLAGMPEAVRFRELILREVAALRRQVAEQGMVDPAAAPQVSWTTRPRPAPAGPSAAPAFPATRAVPASPASPATRGGGRRG